MNNLESTVRQLRVLTLNCWGLKFVATARRERLLAIADWIAHSRGRSSSSSYHSDATVPDGDAGGGGDAGYDVIALQEIWCEEDYLVVSLRAKEAGLKYSRFFHSGAIGSGLALLSAHPISESFIYPYPLNGYPLHFIEGDFFAAKSVCGISIQIEGVGSFEVLNTHMYAPGGEGETIEGAHRVAQSWELAKIVRNWSERGRFVILMGDLNSQPDSIIINLLSLHASLIDAFKQTHDPPPAVDSIQHRALTPVEALHAHGITCDSPLNTYSAPKLAKKSNLDDIVLRGGKRLDYVLYRSPVGADLRMVAESAEVTLTEMIPSLGYSYSDHFGLEVTFSFLPLSSTVNLAGRTIISSTSSLSISLLNQAIENLSAALTHSLSSSRLQLRLFALSLILVPVLAISASFQPMRAINWIFVLLGIATGAGGATMLYSGFVGGRWEAGALKNVIGELQHELEYRIEQ